MKKDDLFLRLIKIKSESRDEKAIGDFIYNRLRKKGFVVKKQIVNKKLKNFNIYAYVGKPRIIFSNHIDTVLNQLEIKKYKNKIFGRGACDNKSQVAAAILSAERALNMGLTNFGLLFTVQEELDFAGVKKVINLIPSCELIVVGEPTSLEIVKGHNGILKLELIAKGKSAHGSVPEKGINAIEILIDDLNKLRDTDLGTNKILGKNILNIAKISGGIADNIVPDYAKALIVYRTVTDSTSLLKKIKSLVKSEVKILSDFKPVFNNITGNIVKIIKTKVGTVRYFTEASILRKKAKVLIIIGAGDIKEAHGPNEFVSIKEYDKLINIYFNLIRYYNN